jgi:hypothetical protein
MAALEPFLKRRLLAGTVSCKRAGKLTFNVWAWPANGSCQLRPGIHTAGQKRLSANVRSRVSRFRRGGDSAAQDVGEASSPPTHPARSFGELVRFVRRPVTREKVSLLTILESSQFPQLLQS